MFYIYIRAIVVQPDAELSYRISQGLSELAFAAFALCVHGIFSFRGHMRRAV